MRYFLLDEKSSVEYVLSRPILRSQFNRIDDLNAKEIGDGNLNLIFRVFSVSCPSNALIIKQAPPYLRRGGESWHLSKDRNRIEAEALRYYQGIVPDFVPQVLYHDEPMALFAMEDLGSYELLRYALIQGKQHSFLLDQLTDYVSETLFRTSDLFLPGQEKKELQRRFINPALCKVQEDLVFSNPFTDSPDNSWHPDLTRLVHSARKNAELKIRIAELKAQYMCNAQALIHSDLHTGSVMVNDQKIKVIDPEFAFYGPMAYDLAALIQNFAINYLSHQYHTSDPENREKVKTYLLNLICGTWQQFALKFDRLWQENNRGELASSEYWAFPEGPYAFQKFRERYIQSIFKTMIGIAGIKMLRRTIGFVSVPDLTNIRDSSLRARIEETVIQTGIQWILNAEHMEHINDMTDILCEQEKLIHL